MKKIQRSLILIQGNMVASLQKGTRSPCALIDCAVKNTVLQNQFLHKVHATLSAFDPPHGHENRCFTCPSLVH